MNSQASRSNVLMILVAVLVLGGLIFLMVQQYTTLDALRSEIAIEQTTIAEAETRLARLKELAAREDEMETELAVLRRLIPDEPREQDVIRLLQAGADEAEIEMMSIRFADRVDRDDYIEMPLNLIFEGRYAQMLILLDEIHKNDRALRVDEIRMGQGSEALPHLQINIRGSVFYARQ